MKFVLSAGVMFFVHSCMDQYNPRPYWEQFNRERDVARHNSTSLLADKGEVPSKNGGAAASPEQKFATLCSSCHGPKGEGNGSASAGLNPKPRNFHDKAWQAKVTDDHIAGVIKNGGASAGLSAIMPAWGSQLKDDEIKGIVSIIRKFGK